MDSHSYRSCIYLLAALLPFFVSRGDENVTWACNTIMLLSDREAMMRQGGRPLSGILKTHENRNRKNTNGMLVFFMNLQWKHLSECVFRNSGRGKISEPSSAPPPPHFKSLVNAPTSDIGRTDRPGATALPFAEF